MHGKKFFPASKGYPVKSFHINNSVYHRLVQSSDGMTYNLEKLDGMADNGVLTAIKPDGETAWKKDNPTGEITGNESGNLYFHTKYKTILKYGPDGTMEDLSFLVNPEHPCRELFPCGGGIAVVKGSPHAGVHDSFTFFDGKWKLRNPGTGRNISRCGEENGRRRKIRKRRSFGYQG